MSSRRGTAPARLASARVATPLAALLLLLLCAALSPAPAHAATTHHRPPHGGAALFAGIDQPGAAARGTDHDAVADRSPGGAALVRLGTAAARDTAAGASPTVAATPARGPPGVAAPTAGMPVTAR